MSRGGAHLPDVVVDPYGGHRALEGPDLLTEPRRSEDEVERHRVVGEDAVHLDQGRGRELRLRLDDEFVSQ